MIDKIYYAQHRGTKEHWWTTNEADYDCIRSYSEYWCMQLQKSDTADQWYGLDSEKNLITLSGLEVGLTLNPDMWQQFTPGGPSELYGPASMKYVENLLVEANQQTGVTLEELLEADDE